jgi:hypothetical protein
LASREDVEVQKAHIADIVTNAQTAIQTVDFMSIAAQTGSENTALLFDSYLDALAARCAELTIPNWIDRLSGVDAWTSTIVQSGWSKHLAAALASAATIPSASRVASAWLASIVGWQRITASSTSSSGD